MRDYAEEFKDDIKAFQTATDQFYAGEMTVAQYKGISGGFGSYAQRGGKYGMLRLRLSGGRIPKERLRFITECIEKYGIGRIHFTTCQTVQFHDLKPDTICELVTDAWRHGIITRGGGGDYPRNVMASPLSGARPDEAFDVMPYAEAAADYLLGFIHTVKLPRKLKVCFSNDPHDMPHATFRDLGFVAKDNGTFDVYSAGGLGNNPKMGVCVGQDVKPDQILYYIKAMVDTFTAYGNYEQRGRARTRYMQDTLGTEDYAKAYQEKLAAAMQQEDITLFVNREEITKTGKGTISHPRAVKQKQPGLYAVSYHPVGGCPSPKKLKEIYDAILPMEDVELRLAPNEGMYLVHCTAEEAEKLIELTKDSAATAFEASVACIGNRICQVGVRDSQALLNACVDAVHPLGFADGVLPKIHISGCPSSCSAHQIGSIGFRGAVKQTPDGPKAAYAMFAGGCETLGKERFGEDVCVMAEEDIPKFFVELGQRIAREHSTYDAWIVDHRDELLAIAGKYA